MQPSCLLSGFVDTIGDLGLMPVPTVTIVSGTESPLSEGVTGPFRCLVRLPDDDVRAAVVKKLTAQGVAAEVFCALLLKGWGLSVPEPAIVSSPLAFASMDVGYPNMKQRIGWSETLQPDVKEMLVRRGAELVSGFAETPLALVADEAIDNRDRNLGNILWDGQNVAWIDHERALGIVPMPDMNKLARMAITSTKMETIQRTAVSIALGLSAKCISDVEQEIGQTVDSAMFASVVSMRLQRLAEAILKRFPPIPGLFSGVH
jgi:hypothetical protein